MSELTVEIHETNKALIVIIESILEFIRQCESGAVATGAISSEAEKLDNLKTQIEERM